MKSAWVALLTIVAMIVALGLTTLFASGPQASYKACIENRRAMFIADFIAWATALGLAERAYHAGRITEQAYKDARDHAYIVYLPQLDDLQTTVCK